MGQLLSLSATRESDHRTCEALPVIIDAGSGWEDYIRDQ